MDQNDLFHWIIFYHGCPSWPVAQNARLLMSQVSGLTPSKLINIIFQIFTHKNYSSEIVAWLSWTQGRHMLYETTCNIYNDNSLWICGWSKSYSDLIHNTASLWFSLWITLIHTESCMQDTMLDLIWFILLHHFDPLVDKHDPQLKLPQTLAANHT